MSDLWTRLRKAKKRDPDYEKIATQELHDQRNMEVEAQLPHPQCCLQAKYIFPYRDFDYRTSVARNDGKPEWRSTFSTQWRGGYGDLSLPIAFCPFCGTRLPDLRRKLRPPEHLRDEGLIDDCDRCGDRNCYCGYPESAWEPV